MIISKQKIILNKKKKTKRKKYIFLLCVYHKIEGDLLKHNKNHNNNIKSWNEPLLSNKYTYTIVQSFLLQYEISIYLEREYMCFICKCTL